MKGKKETSNVFRFKDAFSRVFLSTFTMGWTIFDAVSPCTSMFFSEFLKELISLLSTLFDWSLLTPRVLRNINHQKDILWEFNLKIRRQGVTWSSIFSSDLEIFKPERSGVLFSALSPSTEIIFEFQVDPMLENTAVDFILVWVVDLVALKVEQAGLTSQLKNISTGSLTLYQ